MLYLLHFENLEGVSEHQIIRIEQRDPQV